MKLLIEQNKILFGSVVIVMLLIAFFVIYQVGLFNNGNGVCGKIADEMECFGNPSCKGQYGPSSCRGGICTADEVFKTCVEKPQWEIEAELEQKKECEERGLTWEKTHPLVMPVCK